MTTLTPEQDAALRRLRTRAWLLHSEAQHWLVKAALDSGDVTALALAGDAAEALGKLHDYVTSRLVEAEGCGDG